MIGIIAEVLRTRLSEISWAERVAGLTLVAQRPQYRTGADMVSVQTGLQSYPVAAEVNQEDCWENGVYKLLEPDGTKAAVLFFMDDGGVQQLGIEGPRQGHLRYTFNLKLLCWVNLKRIGEGMTGDYNVISGRLAPYVIAQLFGRHSIAGLFAGGPEEAAFGMIEVKSIDELRKSPTMFEPFDFAKRAELFFWPYDYFGLSVKGEFVVKKDCLSALGADWQPTTGCLAPAWDLNWFSREGADFLAGLPVFNSNEDALAGIDINGADTDPLNVGDVYWAGPGHVAGSDAFMRVV